MFILKYAVSGLESTDCDVHVNHNYSLLSQTKTCNTYSTTYYVKMSILNPSPHQCKYIASHKGCWQGYIGEG